MRSPLSATIRRVLKSVDDFAQSEGLLRFNNWSVRPIGRSKVLPIEIVELVGSVGLGIVLALMMSDKTHGKLAEIGGELDRPLALVFGVVGGLVGALWKIVKDRRS